MGGERLGVALLDLKTNDAGYHSGTRAAKVAANDLGQSFDNTSAKAALTQARIERLTGVTGGLRRSSADIDSYGRALDEMRARYNPIFAAHMRYRDSLAEIRRAHAVGAISADEMAAAISRERQQALLSIGALKGRATAMQQMGNSTRYAAMQQRMLVFQMNDVFVSLASGMNPLMVFIQQGSQISQIYGPQEGGAGRAIREMGQMVTRTASRFPLLIGAVALAAAGIAGMTYEIDQSTKYSVSMGDVMIATLQSIGHSIVSSIEPALEALGTTFGQVWDWIVEGTRVTGNILVNGIRLTILRMATHIKGVTIVYGTVLDTIVDNWSNLPGIMGDLTISAANRVVAGVEDMVNGSIARINGLIDMLPEWVGIDTIGRVEMGRFANPFEGMAGAMAAELAALPDEIGAEIAALLQESAAQAADIVASDPMGSFFQDVRRRAIERARERREGEDEGTEAEAGRYRSIVESAREFIRTQEMERQAIGLTEQAAAALRYEHQLLNQAMRAGVKLTDEQREYFRQLAIEMAGAEAQTDAVRERMELLRESSRDFVTTFRDGLRQGQNVLEAFTNALSRLLDRLADRALDAFLDGIFERRGGGGGGNGAGGGMIQAVTSFFAGFFAKGGLIPNGSFGIVGEAGPEPVFGTSQGPMVLPNSAMRSLEGGGGRDRYFVVAVDKSEYFDTAVQEVAGPLVQEGVAAGFSMSEAAAEKRSFEEGRHLK